MAIRTYKVTLDSNNTIAPEPVYLRQGDKTGAVVIDATLMDNGSPVSLSGLTPMFKANTADGKAVIADGGGFSYVNAAGGELTYQVPNALASVPGKIKNAYFSLSDSSGVQSTFSIPFTVLPAADVTLPGALDYITIVDGTNSDIRAIINSYNVVPNGRFQEGISGSVVPSVAGVSVSQVKVDGANWAKAVSPSGTVNNQGLGMIVPRLNKSGQAVIGSGTYRVSFRLFSWANQTLKVTIIPRDASGNWLPSFDVGSFSASSSRNMRINDSVRLDVSGSEKDFLIMVWNTNSQPVNFAATDFTMIKEDDVVTGSDLESGYVEAANRDNLFENSFFTEGTTPWQKGGTDVDFRNELYADKKWLHVWTGGHTGESVSYVGAAGTELVSGIQNYGVRGSLIFKFNIASVLDIHAIFRDAKGTVLDDVIVNTVKSRDLTVPTKVNFFIPRIARPDLSSVLITLKDHYSAPLDFNVTEIVGYPIALEKPDRLSTNVVDDPTLKTGTAYFRTSNGGGYFSVMLLNHRWVKYLCRAASKQPTSRLEYLINNEETTNDDFRTHNISIEHDVLVDTTGTYTVNATSYDKNNNKVRDYVITSVSLTAGVINHIDFRLPRLQPDEFSFGFGLCSSSTGDLSYSVSNFNVHADVDVVGQGDYSFNSETHLPIVKIDGTFPAVRGDKTTVTVKIIKEGVVNNYFAKLSIQGDSSATYAKKNYKLKLYSDAACTTKAKFKPSPSWINEGTLVLKANWIDATHALNIVSAKLFAAITQNRANVNSNLLNASMLGQIQGIPSLLYTNSSFHGLYTINTRKDENLFGFGDVPTNAGVLEAQNGFKDKGFGKPEIVITDDIKANPNADIEVQVGKTTVEFQAATNRLAQFVSQSDDSTFHDQFRQYLDLDAVIDFLIFYQVAECSDSYIKNIEYTTYDGKIWMLIPYDLDSTWGLNWDGKTIFDPEMDMLNTGLTSKNFDNFKLNTLLNRTLKAFKPEIKARYAELRTSVLTPDKVTSMFEEFMNSVGTNAYAKELSRWPAIPSTFLDFVTLRKNILTRFRISDYIFKNL
ncbi:CotH kinase family protein [Lacticaseibacillus rhamnosus]|uniref:CotH kinase family protein n=1 Tax=Lacticaseibacillus rhamnosus TaxID=47715 RepID=UPI001951B399|nr:CotH kinase family protein [Lacticaseibacillus rhamnosus]MBM6408665.1 CotH kinase family protein [Lacticaseibacillus rhamnosus]